MITDIEKAFIHFKDVADIYKGYFDYYDGDQPLRYSAERLKKAFEQIDVKFRENWCAVVVDAVLDRLELYGWSAGDETVSNLLSEIWMNAGLALESNEVHESALICGESFLVGWQDEGQPMEFYYNDPRRCACFYDDDHPKVKTFAAKWWDADDGAHMVLYYPDRLEKYIARGRKFAEIDDKTGNSRVFSLESSETNPYGVIPVFHFRNSLRTVKSDLKNVVESQDAINKLFGDMMVTAEFAAFPARYVISNTEINELKNSPGQIWDLPAGLGEGQGTQVGTLEAANLANYSDQIDHLASYIAVVTKTPKHYLITTSAQISGEALITMEAPLVKKVRKKEELFGDVWQEVAVFALQLSGMSVKKTDIQPQWSDPEAEQPLTETEIIRNYRGAGLPLKSSLRMVGYTEAEIATIEEEMAEEKQANADLAALYLEQARSEERGD